MSDVNKTGTISADNQALLDAQAAAQTEALAMQLEMSASSRAFDIESATVEKGDKAFEKVGDRLAS